MHILFPSSIYWKRGIRFSVHCIEILFFVTSSLEESFKKGVTWEYELWDALTDITPLFSNNRQAPHPLHCSFYGPQAI